MPTESPNNSNILDKTMIKRTTTSKRPKNKIDFTVNKNDDKRQSKKLNDVSVISKFV